MTLDNTPQNDTDFFITISKWLFGVSGIGIVVSCSLAISGYNAYMTAPEKCTIQIAAADAISGGKDLAIMFCLPGFCAILGATIPTIARLFRKKEKRGFLSFIHNLHKRDWIIPAGWLILQTIFISVSIVSLVVVLIISFRVTNNQSSDNLKAFYETKIVPNCPFDPTK